VSGPEDDTQAAIDALQRVEAARCSTPGGRTPTPEFDPPSTGALPFTPPVEHDSQSAKTSAEPARRLDFLDDPAIRRLAEQLRADPRRKWRLGPVPLAFVCVVAVALSAFGVSRLGAKPRSTERSLLKRYEEELARETARELPPPRLRALSTEAAGGQSRTAANLVAPQDRRPKRVEEPMPPALQPVGPRASSSSSSGADAKAIDRDLQETFGGQRPTIPGPSSLSGPPMPSWVKGVQVAEAKPTTSEAKKLGGRYGDHLRFQLRSNLDSRLCGSGAVEAILVRPYLVNGTPVLPARTLAYGQCSAQGGRFLITFTRLRLPDGAESAFDGLAMDVADGKPGLLASRRMSAERSGSQPSVGGEIAKGAASTVLGAATGGVGLAGQVANSAGQTAINARSEQPVVTEDALLLHAGAGIEVFVRQGF
jgi:hypothetical protein